MKEYKAHADNDSSLKELVQAHRQLSQMAKAIASSAEKMDDAYSHDLLVQRSGAHDKFAWMLQSLL
ncbi:MAG: hypothetical protein COT73_00170 [Bdellovibrio sp. CG10_big_fil_rev_8_21_14_0_10_47_8]|nr:MAG: hypothetical protein COT73_00170 [Bdellovibrio sp. CG10_big_fil_rev_8_21_14_0_10_47_8]